MRETGKILELLPQRAQCVAAQPAGDLAFETGEHRDMMARQTRPFLVEEFEQGQQPGFQPPRRHRQITALVQRHRHGFLIVERADHREQPGLFAQQAQQRRHQADALAADHHAKIEGEPVAAGFRREIGEPFVGGGQLVGKIVGDDDPDAGLFEYRHILVEKGQPARRIVIRQQQTVVPGIQPLLPRQALPPAFQTACLQAVPEILFGAQVAQPYLRFAIGGAAAQQRRGLFVASDRKALGIIEQQGGDGMALLGGLSRRPETRTAQP
jgi:hypothetical protein